MLGLAAVLLAAVATFWTAQVLAGREASAGYEAALQRWETPSEEAARATELAGAIADFDEELDGARTLSEVLPEALAGTESKAALAAAVTSGAEARDALGETGAEGARLPPHAVAPESVDGLRKATAAIEAALASRERAQRNAEESLRTVTQQRETLAAAADAARSALVAGAATQAEPLTSASPEALQALADASSAASTSPLPGAAAAAAALVAALDKVRAEHDAAVAAAEQKTAERVRSAATADDPASITVVVNKQRPFNPIDWEPGDLRTPAGIPNTNGQPVRGEAATALESMYAEASAAGLPFTITSAYRSYAYQTSLFDSYAARDGLAAAETYSARAGYSEHQTGLTVDLDDGSGCTLESCFGETATGQWLRANASRFGYILRYDAGQEPIVGFIYEPWHFRYVGAAVSEDMRSRGIVNLEDYFGLPPAPTY